MATLINWDFNDQDLNSTGPQINRQKSAQNVQVISIDKEKKAGIFSDKRNHHVNTTLGHCDCKDYNFSGNAPRKKFAPCMHIYKLAMELDIFSNLHFDHKTINAMLSPEEKKEIELLRIQNIEKDPTQWGGWGLMVHTANQQQARQHRGYEIFESKDYESLTGQNYMVSGYNTFLDSCMCLDFEKRRLPCKHIYCLALLNNIQLPVSLVDYQKESERFKQNFVPIFSISVKIEE